MRRVRNRAAGFGLAHGFAAGERHAVQQRILADFADDAVGVHQRAAGKVMRRGIMAAGAVVRAALHEHGIADARPIDDAVVCQTKDADFHGNCPSFAVYE